ncbi:hypothetical protein P167DRAFT_125490 [Morchella conica CCBAS932]|uniref:Uncharacterized protein n=1 Tax=Morchella conica CCBAS932 TaxID=1392247 RepID=A0A3N4L340_9PEZI|nr:hypothetical protein P167DRAFT_125490 [Morchella conica CCBAS932]
MQVWKGGRLVEEGRRTMIGLHILTTASGLGLERKLYAMQQGRTGCTDREREKREIKIAHRALVGIDN